MSSSRSEGETISDCGNAVVNRLLLHFEIRTYTNLPKGLQEG